MNKLKTLTIALYVLFATFVLSLAAGCSGDITDRQQDIDELKKRVTDIETAISDLNAKYDAGFLVTGYEPLADGSGYRITFSDGSGIDIHHGGEGQRGQTSEIRVASDGRVWIDGSESDITVTASDDVWAEVEADITAPSAGNPLLAVIIDDRNGTVTFVLNNEAKTRLTFRRASSARSFVILTDVVAFNGSESVDVLFRVNPSMAWIPTGTGDALEKWTLDQIGTRASYLNPAAAFSIESIAPDGDKTGQYVATIAGDAFKHNPEVSEYMMTLVLNNKAAVDDADDLISSDMFRVTQSGHALTYIVMDSRIYFDDYHKNGTSNFSLRLSSIDYSDPLSAGYDFTIDFTSPQVEDGYEVQYIQIPNGEYSFNGGIDAWSIYQGDIWEYPGDGSKKFYGLGSGGVESGTMTVTGGPTEYTIEFNVVTGGGKTIVAKYVGEIVADNPWYWSHSGNLDVRFPYAYPRQTRDANGYLGDAYGMNASTFQLLLQTFDNTAHSPWNGWELGVEIQTTPVEDGIYTEFVEIPAGTYTFNNTKSPGTVVMGSVYVTEVKNGSAGVTAPIVGGTLVVSGNSSAYNMVFDIQLANGTIYKARYEGPLAIPNPYGLPPVDATVAGPTALEVTRVSSNGATLAWQNTGADGWALRVQGNVTQSTEGLTDEFVIFYPKLPNPGYVVDGLLNPESTYRWQVAAIKGGKRSNWVEGPQITTPAPPLGGELNLSEIAKWELTLNPYGNGAVDAWLLGAHQPGVRVEDGVVKGTGYFLESIFHVPAQGAGAAMIQRLYTINSSYERFTVLAGMGYGQGGTKLTYMENDAPVRELYIVSGTVNVTFGMGKYSFVYDAMDSIGNKWTIRFSTSG